MSINQTDKTIQFIIQVFFNSLTYSDGIYRTQKIHPLFADKALVLKEKRLIEIDKTLLFSADLPDGIREQTGIELLGGLNARRIKFNTATAAIATCCATSDGKHQYEYGV